MISELKERTIGKIVQVDAYKLEAELLNWVHSFNINGFDDIYQFIRLNGYVLVRVDNNFIVASISSIRDRDDNNNSATDKNALNKIKSIKILELFPIGVISGKSFSFGVSNYPMLYSDVLYIKEKELNQLFLSESPENESLEIGQWTLMDKYKVKININNFFGFHSAVLGNTGSGKSCTISTIVQSVFKDNKYPNAKFIFFDVNGEYKKAFMKEKEREPTAESLPHISLKNYNFPSKTDTCKIDEEFDAEFNEEFNKKFDKEFHLPLNLLTIDEWELLLQASSKSQAPILRNALGLYSLSSGEGEKEEKIKTYILCRFISEVLSNSEKSQSVAKINTLSKKIHLKKPLFTYTEELKERLGMTSIIKFPKEEGTEHTDEMYHDFSDFLGNDRFTTYINKIAKENYVENIQYDYIGKSNIDLKELEHYIDFAIQWEEAHGNKQIRDYCSSMITRLKSLSSRSEFSFFKPSTSEKGGEEYINNLIGKNNITIINFDNIDDEVITVVSAILTRILFDKVKTSRKRNKEPINLVLDEAHRYIARNKNPVHLFEANRIFERVAKEARKYGLLLMLSSQRPSELNETVLSQCSNFIIHRIQNPDDLQYIRSMTPFISKAILSQLPSIPKQEALIFGTATNLPVLFKVKDAAPLPDSKSNDVAQNWINKEPDPFDIFDTPGPFVPFDLPEPDTSDTL